MADVSCSLVATQPAYSTTVLTSALYSVGLIDKSLALLTSLSEKYNDITPKWLLEDIKVAFDNFYF